MCLPGCSENVKPDHFIAHIRCLIDGESADFDQKLVHVIDFAILVITNQIGTFPIEVVPEDALDVIIADIEVYHGLELRADHWTFFDGSQVVFMDVEDMYVVAQIVQPLVSYLDDSLQR